MKQAILTNWTFTRALRLTLGIIIIGQAISAGDMLLIAAGLLFAIMPVLNIGCCGAGSCFVRPEKFAGGSREDITYEEIK